MSADMTTDLVKRLEAGSCWLSKEVDDLTRTLFGPSYTFEHWSLVDDAVKDGDLNAAAALVERNEDVLTWEASNTPAGPFGRIVTTRANYKGVGATPAAALIAALLNAKRADSSTHTEEG